jgi:hypothetical protein
MFGQFGQQFLSHAVTMKPVLIIYIKIYCFCANANADLLVSTNGQTTDDGVSVSRTELTSESSSVSVGSSSGSEQTVSKFVAL